MMGRQRFGTHRCAAARMEADPRPIVRAYLPRRWVLIASLLVHGSGEMGDALQRLVSYGGAQSLILTVLPSSALLVLDASTLPQSPRRAWTGVRWSRHNHRALSHCRLTVAGVVGNSSSASSRERTVTERRITGERMARSGARVCRARGPRDHDRDPRATSLIHARESRAARRSRRTRNRVLDVGCGPADRPALESTCREVRSISPRVSSALVQPRSVFRTSRYRHGATSRYRTAPSICVLSGV